MLVRAAADWQELRDEKNLKVSHARENPRADRRAQSRALAVYFSG